MKASVCVIPKEILRRFQRFLDLFQIPECPHDPTRPKFVSSPPSIAAHEPVWPFQSIGDLAANVVEDAALRRTGLV